MMDIVIPLGNGSRWQNNELRYTLRGFENHLSGIGKLYIVGEFPKWLQNAIHIPFSDGFVSRDKNICDKILAAINTNQLSQHFFCTSDDHFILRDYNLDEFPFYTNGTLQELQGRQPEGATYATTISNTIKQLQNNKRPQANYNLHCPIVYNRDLFLKLVPAYNWQLPYGLLIKSLYCNSLSSFQAFAEPYKDMKLKQRLTPTQITDKVSTRSFFSIGDEALNTAMKTFLQETYPGKSRWEK